MKRSLSYVAICLSDSQMDHKGRFGLPLNARPDKCHHCKFPDLDHVPQPYLIGRGVTRPCELDMADVGNFLARERARKVIEAVCPGQCEFYPTFDSKTEEPTPWSLAVPARTVAIGSVKAEVPRCPECGEPKVAHWGSQYDWSGGYEEQFPDSIGADIAKSSGWFSAEVTGEESRWYIISVLKIKLSPKDRLPYAPPHHWTRLGLNRSLYFSVRLEHLFKKLGIKGVVRLLADEARPTGDDLFWVDEQTRKMTELGLSTPPDSSDSVKVSRWFRGYVKKYARKWEVPPDFSSVEARIGKPLPASYKAFISKVGPTTFHDLDETEGFDASILGPDGMNTVEYRRDTIRVEGEESARIDGLLFATTGHGDAFCFDLSGDGPEYPVYLHEHELDGFQAYAPNFEECVKRFAGG